MTLQPWKLQGRESPVLLEGASMGPWLLCHGDAYALAAYAAWVTLQWGHGFSAMEMDDCYVDHGVVKVLQWGHGFSAMEMA